MLTLLLLFLITWLLVKLGIGVFKISFFLLTCGIIFVFFIHLLLPLLLIAAAISLIAMMVNW
ncbi:hypothetical protein OZY43_00320 [Lactobacillus sp. ESL0785]|uniref:hypothetical protein n=1 Tax=Lactobacillus sp. ESL0785 TaxID=2983232 RepID=UPI0023F9B642|nr:hypothetical protein [Lactobacillus sp. ESL0785]WEV70926.1 hypothetical protein OZY43_00320 [Lactobacillus sp. ESL0785]